MGQVVIRTMLCFGDFQGRVFFFRYWQTELAEKAESGVDSILIIEFTSMLVNSTGAGRYAVRCGSLRLGVKFEG